MTSLFHNSDSFNAESDDPLKYLTITGYYPKVGRSRTYYVYTGDRWNPIDYGQVSMKGKSRGEWDFYWSDDDYGIEGSVRKNKSYYTLSPFYINGHFLANEGPTFQSTTQWGCVLEAIKYAYDFKPRVEDQKKKWWHFWKAESLVLSRHRGLGPLAPDAQCVALLWLKKPLHVEDAEGNPVVMRKTRCNNKRYGFGKVWGKDEEYCWLHRKEIPTDALGKEMRVHYAESFGAEGSFERPPQKCVKCGEMTRSWITPEGKKGGYCIECYTTLWKERGANKTFDAESRPTDRFPAEVRAIQNRGFQISFQNGYGVSVMFGHGNYGDHHKVSDPSEFIDSPAISSSTAEVAIFTHTGEVIKDLLPLSSSPSDTVMGWVPPEDITKILAAVATGKEVKMRKVVKAIRADHKAEFNAEPQSLRWMRLQGVGKVPAIQADALKVGDWIGWNRGYGSEVLSIKPRGRKSLVITVRNKKGETHDILKRKDTLVYRVPPRMVKHWRAEGKGEPSYSQTVNSETGVAMADERESMKNVAILIGAVVVGYHWDSIWSRIKSIGGGFASESGIAHRETTEDSEYTIGEVAFQGGEGGLSANEQAPAPVKFDYTPVAGPTRTTHDSSTRPHDAFN